MKKVTIDCYTFCLLHHTKVFDKVAHTRGAGIAYLNRSQEFVCSYVSQGSILGPVLFVVMEFTNVLVRFCRVKNVVCSHRYIILLIKFPIILFYSSPVILKIIPLSDAKYRQLNMFLLT